MNEVLKVNDSKLPHIYFTNLSLDVMCLTIEEVSTMPLPSLKEDEVFGRPSDEH
jgi:hypothetical protein